VFPVPVLVASVDARSRSSMAFSVPSDNFDFAYSPPWHSLLCTPAGIGACVEWRQHGWLFAFQNRKVSLLFSLPGKAELLGEAERPVIRSVCG
jgi:hypothetical protein